VSVLAVDRVGRVAYLDRGGHLLVSEAPDERGDPVEGMEDVTVASAAFATGEDAMAIVVVPLDDPDGTSGTLEHLDLDSGERTILAPDGAHPRWLP
jgi:hypothetical protein